MYRREFTAMGAASLIPGVSTATNLPTQDRVEEEVINPQEVSRISSPLDGCIGIAYDGERIWVAGSADNLLPIDKNGVISQEDEIESRIETPERIYSLAATNGLLYVGGEDQTVYEINPSNGRAEGTNHDLEIYDREYISGLTWGGDSFWMTKSKASQIYRLDQNLNLLSAISLPGDLAGGVTHDGNNLWVCITYTEADYPQDDITATRLLQVSTNGDVLATFNNPVGDAIPGVTTVDSNILLSNPFDNVIVEYQANAPPTADFVYNPNEPDTKTQINLQSDSYARVGKISEHQWQMGDGTTKTGENIRYSYNQPGEYTITLQVQDTNGLTSSVQAQIQVSEPDTVSSTSSNSDQDNNATADGAGFSMGTAALSGGAALIYQMLKTEKPTSEGESESTKD